MSSLPTQAQFAALQCPWQCCDHYACRQARSGVLARPTQPPPAPRGLLCAQAVGGRAAAEPKEAPPEKDPIVTQFVTRGRRGSIAHTFLPAVLLAGWRDLNPLQDLIKQYL